MEAAGRKVLIIDDNDVNRKLAGALFRRLGWLPDFAEDGGSGLVRLEIGPVDLVLLDVSMPGLSGTEVCMRIRANPAYSGLPVVAYTAHAMPEDRAGFIAGGFSEVLVKPVTLDGLRAVVSAVAG